MRLLLLTIGMLSFHSETALGQDQQVANFRFNPEKEDSPKGDPKCRAAGYSSQLLEEDKYELGRWQDEHRFNPRPALTPSSCKSATVNPRGTYTSHLVPCTFQFYQSDADETNLDAYALSEVCTVAAAVPSRGQALENYVVHWPDECVADFPRCYLRERDETMFLRNFCKYDWKFPEGATHLLVNCTADKKAKEKRLTENPVDSNTESYLKHSQRQYREFYVVLFAGLSICICAGSCFLGCTHRYAVRPFLATMKKSRSDPELKRLTATDTEKGE